MSVVEIMIIILIIIIIFFNSKILFTSTPISKII